MIDFNKYNKSGTAVANQQDNIETTTTPTATIPPVKKGTIDFNKFNKAGTGTTTNVPTEQKPGWAGEMVKSIVSAPATMIARPFQAAAELAGASSEDVNKFTKDIPVLGKVIAPVPENFADVKKDVGRGVETVALGMGPISGGAAFGAGSSLEQGNDLLSAETLLQTVVGAGAGKILSKVGGPIFDKAGNVIGAVTPKFLKDLALKGAGAVEKWAAEQELLGGIVKPLSEKIATGSKAIDTEVGKLFTGGKGKIGEAVTSQYPGLSKENIQKHYEIVDRKDLIKPTTVPGTTYREATNIYKDAKNRGVELGKVASDNKIYTTDLQVDGKWTTQDAVSALRKETMGISHDLIRPALEIAEPGVERIPLSKIKEDMIANIKNIPKTHITDAERQKLISNITNEFSPGSAADIAHPNGYSLTDLHDNKISTSNNVIYKTLAPTIQDNLSNTYYKTQSKVFKKLLEKTAPPELKIDLLNKEFEKRFILADYLEKLNGKKVPTSLFQKAAKTGGKIAGATLGGSTGNIFGAFGGYHAGALAMDTFINASNPVKTAYLRSIEKTQPEIFQAFKDYFGENNITKLMLSGKRLQLPESKTIFVGPK